MAECYHSVSELELDFEQRISAVDAILFRQQPGDSFRPSAVPFDVLLDGGSLGHLLFEVYVEDGDVVSEETSTANVEASVVVQLTYHERPETASADKRASQDAIHAAVKSIAPGATGACRLQGIPTRQRVEGHREWYLLTASLLCPLELAMGVG